MRWRQLNSSAHHSSSVPALLPRSLPEKRFLCPRTHCAIEWWWLHTFPRLTHSTLTSPLFFPSQGVGWSCRNELLSNRKRRTILHKSRRNSTSVALIGCTLLHYDCASIDAHIVYAAFFPFWIEQHILFQLVLWSSLVRSPHLLPWPYKAFLLHVGRCNLRGKLTVHAGNSASGTHTVDGERLKALTGASWM